MNGPLDGLRLVEFCENLAGPYCCMLLADMGMDVVKVERPERGDNIRGWAPQVNGVSLAFTQVNRNKRSIALDLKHPRGREIALALAARADVMVENFRPGTLADVGLGYDAVRAINPRIVYCSISGFGQTGPYRSRGGLDLIAQAMSGLMSVTGEPDRSPAKAGFPVTDLGAGTFAAFGIVCALQARERTGEGQYLDTSLFETGVAWSVWQMAKYLGTGEPPGPMGSAHPLSAPYQAFRTADGYLVIGAGSQSLFTRLCQVLDVEELLSDPRFATPPARMDNMQALAEALEKRFATRTSSEWEVELDRVGIPYGRVQDMAQVATDPQTQARNMLLGQEHPVAGPIRVVANPLKLHGTPWSLRRPAPGLGEHTEEILAELGYDAQAILELREAAVASPQ